jgi:hypothetical protein
MTCNYPSCQGEGPPDGPDDEPSDEFVDEWIEDERNRDFIIDQCYERIEADWLERLENKKNEAQESLAEERKETS